MILLSSPFHHCLKWKQICNKEKTKEKQDDGLYAWVTHGRRNAGLLVGAYDMKSRRRPLESLNFDQISKFHFVKF